MSRLDIVSSHNIMNVHSNKGNAIMRIRNAVKVPMLMVAALLWVVSCGDSQYSDLGSITNPSITANGLTLNGPWLNGLTLNGLTLNGLTLNGLTLNGLTLNGLTLNGLTLIGTLFSAANQSGAVSGLGFVGALW